MGQGQRWKTDEYPKICKCLMDIAVNDTGNMSRLAMVMTSILSNRLGSNSYNEAIKQLRMLSKHVAAVNSHRTELDHE